MALIDDVKAICDRLAPLGWRDRLLLVTGNTLDISQSTNDKLKTALTAVLPVIDRTQRGFEDFHSTSEPGHHWRKPRAKSVVSRAGQFLGASHRGRCSFSESQTLPDS